MMTNAIVRTDRVAVAVVAETTISRPSRRMDAIRRHRDFAAGIGVATSGTPLGRRGWDVEAVRLTLAHVEVVEAFGALKTWPA
jgi:hypothetical protein